MNTLRRLRKRAWEIRWILLASFLAAAAVGYVIAEMTT